MAIAREEILEAALAVLNEVGLDRLSTRRLAERLGVQQPALYWHFRNKSALLDALNALMLERYHDHRVPAPSERWDEFAVANARSFRKAMRSVRDGARLNASTRPNESQFADAERQLELYVAAGFSPEEAFTISIGIARYVTGFVVEEQDERGEDSRPSVDADHLAEVAPFPLLLAALRPLLKAGTINTEEVFERGLGYMLAGIRGSLASPPKRRAQKKTAP